VSTTKTETDSVVDIPTDANLARLARTEISPLLDQLAIVMNKYRSQHGLILGFSIQLDQFGRHRPSHIDVTRPL
jgi:hypothetical protein